MSAERQDHLTQTALRDKRISLEKQVSWEHFVVKMLDAPLQNLVEQKRLEGFDVEKQLLGRNGAENGKEEIGLLRGIFARLLLRKIVVAITVYRLRESRRIQSTRRMDCNT